MNTNIKAINIYLRLCFHAILISVAEIIIVVFVDAETAIFATPISKDTSRHCRHGTRTSPAGIESEALIISLVQCNTVVTNNFLFLRKLSFKVW